MPVALRELQGTKSMERDAAKKRVATRVWHAPVSSQKAAEAVFDSDANYSFYPDEPTLTFDRVAFSPNDRDTGWTVTAYFSNNRAGRFSQTPPRDDPNYYSFDWDFRTVQVEIPYSAWSRTVIEAPGGGAQTVGYWAIAKQILSEPRVLRIFKVRIPKPSNVNAFDVVAEQHQRIHRILGINYQFMGMEKREIDGQTLDLIYTWELDKGTPLPSPNHIDGEFDIQPAGTEDDPFFLRPAYSRLIPIAPDDPRAMVWRNRALFQWTFDPDGWQVLPGLERL